MLTALGVTFVAMICLGIPMAFGMGIAGATALLVDGSVPLKIIVQRMYAAVDSFPLMAVPFFMLAGELMGFSGILHRLVAFAEVCVGRIRGGLAHISILSAMIFAGVTGAATAEATALGSILIPSLREEYDLDFGCAVVAGAATIGPIIPPSMPAIIYAILAGPSVSVAGLFLAGVIPGILMGLGMMVIAYVIAVRRNYPVRRIQLGVREFARRTLQALPMLLMPVIVIGGILGGVFTATEAAAVAVVYALVVGFAVTRQLRVRNLPGILVRSAMSTSVVAMLMATANTVSWLLTIQQVPTRIGAFLRAQSSNPWVFLLLVMFFLIIVGCLIESVAAYVMFVPILAPMAAAYGLHPLYFGFLVILNLVVGMLTPPIGVVLFVICGVAGITLERLVRAVWPFVLWQFVVLFLVLLFPGLALWIPGLFGYR